MTELIHIFKNYGTQLSTLGAAIAFVFAVYKYQIERKTTLFWKEFEVYHKLVKELVQPPKEEGALFIDRQTAVLFEMRQFKRYFPHTLRMLKGLEQKWKNTADKYPRLLEELDLTIRYIESKL